MFYVSKLEDSVVEYAIKALREARGYTLLPYTFNLCAQNRLKRCMDSL